MAAALPTIQPALVDRGWPSWFVSLAEGSPREVPRHSRVLLGGSRGPRSLGLFCETGKLKPEIATSADCAVVFEGFLYQAADMAAELGIAGRFPDNASLLLEGYRHWGEDLLGKLRGLFALVVWDSKRDVLICARDAFGNHPLFFAKGERELVLSTSLDSLVHHPAISAELNRPAIFNSFLGYMPWLKETFYAHVDRIPPGHAMRASRGGVEIFRYWDPHPPDDSSLWIKEDELGRFDELLTQAVDRFLELGPTGIYLSGGLDSVSVAAVATDRSATNSLPRPRALSLIFPHPEANEEQVQRSVAQRLGLSQDLVPFDVACGAQGFLESALELSRSLTLPLQNFWIAAYNHLALLGKQHGCSTILTGGGGDEWLGVSPLLSADLIRSLDFAGLYQLWGGVRRSYRRPLHDIARSLLWSFGVRPLLRDNMVRTLGKRSPSTLAWLRRRNLRKLMPSWRSSDPELWRQLSLRAQTVETDRTREPARYGYYFAEIRLSLDHPLVAWEMEEAFENGKRLGMRFLQPYFDTDLVEMLYRTPMTLLNRGGRAKGLVRETISRRFPGLGFDRQKKIEIREFFAQLMRRDGNRLWKDMGGAQALGALNLVDPERVDSFVHTAINSGEHRQAFDAWMIMNMESWLRPRL
jgi:asparagine synthetase B (glutamine-hydrolysing)